MSHEVFLREKLIHTKLHIKLKKLEFYFNFSLLPSSKMVANENLQVDIPSRISPSESAEQSPGNPTLTGCWRCRFDLWVRKIPWRRKWQPTPVFLPGKSQGQRGLVGDYTVHEASKSQLQLSSHAQGRNFKIPLQRKYSDVTWKNLEAHL